jgi:O-antigen ligase
MPMGGMFRMLKEEKAYTAFSSALLLYTAFSSLSNYSASAFGIKIYCTALLLITGFFLFKFTPDVKINRNRKILSGSAIFTFFTAYFGLSILYSLNPWFGLLKWLNFLLSFLPLICGYYILFSTITRERFVRLSLVVLAVLIFSTMVLIFSQPFNYGGTHWLSLTNWSHVVYGRVIGMFLIIMLILYKTDIVEFKPYLAVVLFVFLFYLNQRTGYRSGLVALALTSPLIILYYLPGKQYRKKLIIIALSVVLTIPLIYLHSSKSNAPQQRVVSLMHYSYGKMSEDEPLQTRYKLNNLCRQFVQEHPITGIGWGGFRNQALDPDPIILKYPHNIMLEFLVELGITGLFVFMVFLIWSIRRLWKIHPLMAISYMYPLTIALFSKDIPDQTLFAVFFAILILPAATLEQWRESFLGKHRESDASETV